MTNLTAQENAERLTQERMAKVGTIILIDQELYKVLGVAGFLCEFDRNDAHFLQNLWVKKVGGRKVKIVTEQIAPYSQYHTAWEGSAAQTVIDTSEWEME